VTFERFCIGKGTQKKVHEELAEISESQMRFKSCLLAHTKVTIQWAWSVRLASGR